MSSCNCCSDSPLFIAVNIIGILIFALGLAASYVPYWALTLGAVGEIQRIHRDIQITLRHTAPLLEYCRDQARENDSIFEVYMPSLKDSLGILITELHSLKTDLDKNHGFDRESRSLLDLQAQRRFSWIYYRQDYIEKMAGISSLKQEIFAAELGVLLRRSSSQDKDLKTLISRGSE